MTSEVAKVRVTCSGCGSEIPVDHLHIGDGKTMVAAMEANPPWCLVCTYRPVFGPRPELEIWEPIPGLPDETFKLPALAAGERWELVVGW
jgi:hypothetical protein